MVASPTSSTPLVVRRAADSVRFRSGLRLWVLPHACREVYAPSRDRLSFLGVVRTPFSTALGTYVGEKLILFDGPGLGASQGQRPPIAGGPPLASHGLDTVSRDSLCASVSRLVGWEPRPFRPYDHYHGHRVANRVAFSPCRFSCHQCHRHVDTRHLDSYALSTVASTVTYSSTCCLKRAHGTS